jgi:DNA repair protein RadD
MINLFDDQEEFVEQLRGALRAGKKSILGVASPAFGKTMVAGSITQTSIKRGSSVWFLVHRKNLLRQTSQSFWRAHIEHGLITSGKRRSTLPVQVGTIGSVHSRLDELVAPALLFVDEAHLARGNMFEKVITWAKDSGAIVIGLTGTPERLDGKSLGDVFDCMVEARSTQWLIEQGRLSTYEMYSTGVMPDLSGVKNSGNDYNREQLADVMQDRVIVGDVVDHWRKLAPGLITVCYCVNVKHSKATAQYFNDSGIPAVHVDADTTEKELKEACLGLASGKYLILCNCELVIEGFDLSSQVGQDITIECCILLRPTQSLARYLQMVFRALRKKDRPAVILDHAGCAMKHGLPDDEREWSLEGRAKGKRKKKDDEPDVFVQQCDTCYHIFRPGVGECPACGTKVEIKPTREIQQMAGELLKIDIETQRVARKREQGSARTLRELIELGIRRKLKKPAAWAAITAASRQGRKPTAMDFKEANDMYRELTR